MAYYSSSYSGSDYGEYNFNSYAVNNYDYDYAQVPAFMTHNSHEYNQPHHGYDPSLYFAPNNYQTIAYSATTFSDPKSLVYDPNYGMTQLVLSYNTMEFNEPAYEEYDPTPYGGGYDISQTYGKPLPPSDKICYPRSGSSPSTSIPFDPVPAGSIVPVPIVEEAIDEKTIKPQNGTAHQATEEKPQSQDSATDQPKEGGDNNHEIHDLKPDEGEDSESSDSGENHHEDDHYSGYGVEKQVPPQYYPSGYGLETLDLCESLFGHWPCLSRMKKRENCCEEARNNCCQEENMWKGTADYLFGSPYPYGGSGYGGDHHLVYGYQRHYPSQAQYRQVDYTDDESW